MPVLVLLYTHLPSVGSPEFDNLGLETGRSLLCLLKLRLQHPHARLAGLQFSLHFLLVTLQGPHLTVQGIHLQGAKMVCKVFGSNRA